MKNENYFNRHGASSPKAGLTQYFQQFTARFRCFVNGVNFINIRADCRDGLAIGVRSISRGGPMTSDPV